MITCEASYAQINIMIVCGKRLPEKHSVSETDADVEFYSSLNMMSFYFKTFGFNYHGDMISKHSGCFH